MAAALWRTQHDPVAEAVDCIRADDNEYSETNFSNDIVAPLARRQYA
jgi:hypothetical protein